MNTQFVLLGLVLSLVLMLSGQVLADEVQIDRISQSVASSALQASEDEEQRLDESSLQMHQPLLRFGSRETSPVMQQRLAAHGLDQPIFWIYDARTELSRDDDDDGFYHRLKVSFDADVDYGDAHVYAMLYLSFEGGPWNHYYTTEVFHIQGDVAYDDYEVVTRLLDGYPSGYYDVLIELYDADWDEQVARYGAYEDPALNALPLEDQLWDESYPQSESHGGGGGFGWLSLGLIALPWGMRGDKRGEPQPEIDA